MLSASLLEAEGQWRMEGDFISVEDAPAVQQEGNPGSGFTLSDVSSLRRHEPKRCSVVTSVLDQVCERLAQVFEDSAYPHSVPFFYDRYAGNVGCTMFPDGALMSPVLHMVRCGLTLPQVTFYGKSRQALETVLFLILYDGISGQHPGFCSVSYEKSGK